MPDQVYVALQRQGALEGLQRVPVVAARLIGVAYRVVRVQVRRVARQGPPAHLEALVVEAGLLEEEAEHGLVLRLVRIGGEASSRHVDAPAAVAPPPPPPPPP